MKRYLVVLIAAIILIGILCSCNVDVIDTAWKFNEAYITLPNGEFVHGKVKSWKDWDGSDTVQVTLDDGHTYYTHMSNVVLVA